MSIKYISSNILLRERRACLFVTATRAGARSRRALQQVRCEWTFSRRQIYARKAWPLTPGCPTSTSSSSISRRPRPPAALRTRSAADCRLCRLRCSTRRVAAANVLMPNRRHAHGSTALTPPVAPAAGPPSTSTPTRARQAPTAETVDDALRHGRRPGAIASARAGPVPNYPQTTKLLCANQVVHSSSTSMRRWDLARARD